eukprot:6491715-Amphidinium_carterae.5
MAGGWCVINVEVVRACKLVKQQENESSAKRKREAMELTAATPEVPGGGRWKEAEGKSKGSSNAEAKGYTNEGQDKKPQKNTLLNEGFERSEGLQMRVPLLESLEKEAESCLTAQRRGATVSSGRLWAPIQECGVCLSMQHPCSGPLGL